MIEFAQSSPYLTFFLAWLIAWAFTRPFRYAFLAYNRHLRAKNIAAHGWPRAPMDADGDIVYPEKEDE